MRFGRLTASALVSRGGGVALWRCHCDCGGECDVRLGNLTSGHSRSCGCIAVDGPPRKKHDLAGSKIGRLGVIEITTRRSRGGNGTYFWRCKCDCGSLVEVEGNKLRSGHTRSCGCLQRDAAATLDGLSANPETRPLWKLWHGIMRRCHNPSDSGYPSYGGRGIAMHEPWRSAPWEFAEWIEANLGARPDEHSLDRIDNDGNYEPGNLRWASRSQQQRNRRPHIYVRGAEAERLRAYAAAHGISPAEALTLAIDGLK